MTMRARYFHSYPRSETTTPSSFISCIAVPTHDDATTRRREYAPLIRDTLVDMSARPFDYSKWDNIELSDDEDSHPGAQFIEAQTLRRIKREAHEHRERERVEKIETLETERREAKRAVKAREESLVALAEGLRVDGDGEAAAETKTRAAEEKRLLEAKRGELASIESKIEELERQKKFNAEEMCYVSSEKTLVGSACAPESRANAETMDYETFTREYGDDLDEIAERNASMSYGELGNWFSTGRLHLLCEHATGYLLLKSLYLEMEKKTRAAKTCARVAFACKSIGEFAEAGNKNERDAAEPFFKRLDSSAEAMTAYEKSFEEYFEKLCERALVKLRERAENPDADADADADGPTSLEEIPLEERLGPGGLDPVAVYDSLPREMRDAFDSGSVSALREFVNALPAEDAARHMKAMVDSGLWVPTPGEDPGTALR